MSLWNTDIKARLRQINGRGKYYFYVNSTDIDSEIGFIKENQIENLMLLCGYAGAYQLNNLDWLTAIGDQINSIILTYPEKGKFNYDGLKFCDALSKLHVNNYTSDQIDLTINRNLKTLSVWDARHLSGIEHLVKLEELVIGKADSLIDNKTFLKLKSLNFLCISNTNLENGLSFLIGTPLRRLDLYSCRKLSLDALPTLNLVSLGIEKCKNIVNSELIFEAASLECLKLVDSVRLDCAKSLSKLVKLKELYMLGTSCFNDGNLDEFKGRFHVFSFDDKRHYNIRYQEFKESFLRV